jgi:hypothetical protein
MKLHFRYLIEDIEEQQQLSMREASKNFAVSREHAYKEMGKVMAYEDVIKKMKLLMEHEPGFTTRVSNFFSNIKQSLKK